LAGAPFGNKNGAKQRLIEQALIREIKQRDLKDGDGETLRKIAAAQIDRALAGEPLGFDRVADRLDGKPAQQVMLQGDAENPLVLKFESPDSSA
jgi:hypothetical protein